MPLFGKFHFLSLKAEGRLQFANFLGKECLLKSRALEDCAYFHFSTSQFFDNFNLKYSSMCGEKVDLDFAETVACLRVPWVGLGYILTRRRGHKHCIGQQF